MDAGLGVVVDRVNRLLVNTRTAVAYAITKFILGTCGNRVGIEPEDIKDGGPGRRVDKIHLLAEVGKQLSENGVNMSTNVCALQ